MIVAERIYLYNNLPNSYPYVSQNYFFYLCIPRLMIELGAPTEEWKDVVTSGGTGMKLLLPARLRHSGGRLPIVRDRLTTVQMAANTNLILSLLLP